MRLRPVNTTTSAPAEPAAAALETITSTPFEVLVSLRVPGEVLPVGGVVAGESAAAQLAKGAELFSLSAQPQLFPGAMPPASGFRLLEEIPVAELAALRSQGAELARQFSGPLGPPASLLKQSVLEVTNGGTKVEIPMRLIFAAHAMGLLPGARAPLHYPRTARISSAGSWVRLDTATGTAYYRSGGPALLFA